MAKISKTITLEDNQLYNDFVKNQKNFSNSMRYLIYQHCMQHGTGDISNKLEETLYSVALGSATNIPKTKEMNEIETTSLEESPKEVVDKVISKKDIPTCYDD